MPDPVDALEAVNAELAALPAVDWNRLGEMLIHRQAAVERAAAWASETADERTVQRLTAAHAAGQQILARWMGARRMIAAQLELRTQEMRLMESLRGVGGGEEWKREWQG